MDSIQQIGLLDDEAIVLDEAALLLAAADHPGVDLQPTREHLGELATALATRGAGFINGRHRARLLADVLARGAGLAGDSEDYENPANADLLMLLRRRRGLPVTLAIVYVALARRIGWEADAINVPGHVLVRVGGEVDGQLLDPFDSGAPVGHPELNAIVTRALGASASVEREHLAAMTNRAILVRLLSNQSSRARRSGDVARALALHERMTAFAPGFSGLWWERARLEQLLGQLGAARASLAAMAETTHDIAVRTRITAALAALAGSTN